MNDFQVKENSKFEEIFKHEDFGEVRTIIGEDGEPWFMLADVCRVLEIKNPSDAKSRLNRGGVGTTEVTLIYGYSSDGTPKYRESQATFINEANLYKLVFQSRKPQAERFADWVTSEVLPSIRKHGVYITEELLADKEKLEKAIEDFTEENAKLKNKLKKVEPYVTFTQDYLHRDDRYVTTTTIASHYNVSARVLNKFLEQKNIQYKKGSTWYMCNEEHAKTLGKHIPLYDKYNHYNYTVWEWNRQGEFFIHKLLQEFLDENS